MSDFWTPVLQGALAVAVASAGGIMLKRGKLHADKTGLTRRMSHALSDGRAYVRSGFRWQAALYFDHPTSQAHAFIGARVRLPDVALRDTEKLLQEAVSRPFQRRASFARQVYATWVPYCAHLYHKALTIEGVARPVTLDSRHDNTWTLDLDAVGGQPCVIIKPDWCPMRELPVAQVRDHRNEGLEMPLAWPPD